MKQANVATLTMLTLILFTGGITLVVLAPYAVLGLGLMMASLILGCTIVVINEVRDAKRRILEEVEKRNTPP